MTTTCWDLDRDAYRARLLGGTYRPGIVFEGAVTPGRTTVIFVHGGGGAPAQFAPLARALRGRASVCAFVYDDQARLTCQAGVLRQEMHSLLSRHSACAPAGPAVLIVAYSLGTLLPAYIGATDAEAAFHDVRAIYLNPLIGGSRYADADPALALLGDLPGLGWLHGVKRAIQGVFFPAVVQDLTPESDFQQTIFGSASCASTFAPRTLILFTEKPGKEPDIRADRVRKFFGRSRRQLVERMGTVLPVKHVPSSGHRALWSNPELLLPPLMAALGGPSRRP